jgi:hypothetical protein
MACGTRGAGSLEPPRGGSAALRGCRPGRCADGSARISAHGPPSKRGERVDGKLPFKRCGTRIPQGPCSPRPEGTIRVTWQRRAAPVRAQPGVHTARPPGGSTRAAGRAPAAGGSAWSWTSPRPRSGQSPCEPPPRAMQAATPRSRREPGSSRPGMTRPIPIHPMTPRLGTQEGTQKRRASGRRSPRAMAFAARTVTPLRSPR